MPGDFTMRLLLDGGKTVEFHGPGDITKETTDAIVNAANSSLLGGGGVDGAIHRAGGPAILAECKRIRNQIGELPAGKAVITTGGRLAAKYVVHTVGPVYGRDRGHAMLLASCHRESIRVADDHAVASIAFPAISTGAFGYPLGEAAPIAVASAIESLSAATHVRLVRFVLFDVPALHVFTITAQNLRNPATSSPYKFEKSPQ
jgi:O-acetyl-ADP-ribose deacetylase (regulator of RNase III)